MEGASRFEDRSRSQRGHLKVLLMTLKTEEGTKKKKESRWTVRAGKGKKTDSP